MHASVTPVGEYRSLLPHSASVDFSKGLLSICLIVKPADPPIPQSVCIAVSTLTKKSLTQYFVLGFLQVQIILRGEVAAFSLITIKLNESH